MTAGGCGHMNITLSLVIPAYNEARRLPPYLESVRAHLDRCYQDAYEVIVVDDGSRDGLRDVLQPWAQCWSELIVIEHSENRGKGAAVRTGMLAARGERLMFADADGATPIDEEAKLTEALLGRAGADVAVGSRLVAAPGVTRRRTPLRGLVGRMFAGVARRWLRIPVHDTQCGFKMFRRDIGKKLFSLGHETGYLFDLELLGLADRFGAQIVEVPIRWADVPGGHLSLMRESGRILLGLWRIRRRIGRGVRGDG